MKKILALTLAMLLCIPALALADIEFSTYTSKIKRYTIDYPSDWMRTGILGFNSFFSDEGTSVIVSHANLGTEITNEWFMETFCPIFVAQTSNGSGEAEVVDPGSIMMAGDNEFVTISVFNYEDGITSFSKSLFFLSGTTMYMLTFSVPNYETIDEETFDLIVETMAASFTPGK